MDALPVLYCLWEGPPPGAQAALPQTALIPQNDELYAIRVSQPGFFIVPAAQPNGLGMVIMPGGGYGQLSLNGEGLAIAHHFSNLGITCLVLTSRLPGDGWDNQADVPLQDAQRAMRLARAMAPSLNIDPNRLGIMGFSAGGHLAATLATRFDEPAYAPRDAHDQLSARPDFAALIYPVIQMDAPLTHWGSRMNLLGEAPLPEKLAARNAAANVDATTPPCFLVHAQDDDVVPVANSLLMLSCLHTHGIASEAHFYPQGGHGFGLALGWEELFRQWLGRMKF